MSEIKMVHLKAKCRQLYSGKYLLPGDSFPYPVAENVAAGLIKNHYAEIDSSYQTRGRPRIERKDLVSEEPAEPVQAEAELQPVDDSLAEAPAEADGPQRRQTRRYQRRDLKAEGE